MKKLLIVLLLLVSVTSPTYAGFYSSRGSGFRYFETGKNLLYVSVAKVKNKKIDSGLIGNIAVVNLSTNSVINIFKTDFNERIENLIFEAKIISSVQENFKGYKVAFNANYGNRYVRNNRLTVNRIVKDKLCILTYKAETKIYSLWYCDKTGANLKRVKSFKANTEWWIDIKNSKIYFMRQVGAQIRAESIVW
jgi:hypothetical protein